MKKHYIIMILALLAPVALSAKSAGQNYVESYKGSIVKPAPISVASPSVKSHWAGKTVDLWFVVDSDGKPRRIVSRSYVDSDLVRQVIDAVSLWRFEPKLDAAGNTVPARVMLRVEIRRADDRSAAPLLYAGKKKNARRDSWKRA